MKQTRLNMIVTTTCVLIQNILISTLVRTFYLPFMNLFLAKHEVHFLQQENNERIMDVIINR